MIDLTERNNWNFFSELFAHTVLQKRSWSEKNVHIGKVRGNALLKLIMQMVHDVKLKVSNLVFSGDSVHLKMCPNRGLDHPW